MRPLRLQRVSPGKIDTLVAPPWDRIVVSDDPESPPWACVIESNPLRHPGGGKRWPTPIADVNCPPRVIAWSGTPAERLFERDPRSWSPESRSGLELVCNQLLPRLIERRRRLVFRPCARHVLADATACASFLKARHGQPFGVLLDYAGMLEPSMLALGVDVAMDHAKRSLEALGPVCDGVLVANAAIDEKEERAVMTPLSQGRLPVEALLRAVRDHCPESVVRIVVEDETSADLLAIG